MMLEVTVSREDIRCGIKQRGQEDPVARGLARALGPGRPVSVLGTAAVVGSQQVPLPPEVVTFVTLFAEGRLMPAFRFQIEVPDGF